LDEQQHGTDICLCSNEFSLEDSFAKLRQIERKGLGNRLAAR